MLYYKEAKDGQILEEGITEAGSMASFIAAGSAYATHGINTIPFFIYYSMFGFQRIADFIWAAADMRTRGFLLGGTAGRTTLSGEGLQHQDGNSHVLALPVPNLLAYDPAFAYEIAVIIQDGIRRMYKEGENIFYYITVMNEPYAMPPMPEGVEEGILKGMYVPRAANKKSKLRAQLFGSGAILQRSVASAGNPRAKVRRRRRRLERHQLQGLYTDGIETERWNRLHPGDKAARALRHAVPRRRAGRARRRVRLLENAAQHDQQVDAAPPGFARHRRLRPQRRPHVAARILRSRRALHRPRHPPRTAPRRPNRTKPPSTKPSTTSASTPTNPIPLYPDKGFMRRARAQLAATALSVVVACATFALVISTRADNPSLTSSQQQFLHKLSDAAIERTHHTVRYDPAYIHIPYPNGDVPESTGVCSDEVIRVYRALGIDLQKEVHEDMQSNFSKYPNQSRWMLQHTDTNIDHRRVSNLMVFFSRKGQSVAITQNAKDYAPGDLVTRDLGGNVPHIGIIVDSKAPSGRYRVVHNIGQGPQIEDVLFDWKITGHYRYFGPATPR